MAQANSTTIQLFYSNTGSAIPLASSLIAGEVAINIVDGKLFYLDTNNAVGLIASQSAANGQFQNVTFLTDGTKQFTAAAPYAYSNASYLQANSSFLKANSAGDYANGAFLQANTANTNATNAGTYANSAFSKANLSFNHANSAFLQANTPSYIANSASAYANGAFRHANASFAFANTLAGGTATDGIGRNIANGAFEQANSAAQYANAAFLQANTPSYTANSADIYANGAFLHANSSFDTANLAFDTANSAYTIASGAAASVTGATAELGSNTVGQLVSNAVTLTTTTKITDGIALLNNVLGKLVPSSPPTFPTGTSLSISGLSTYRMANFAQTDRTATGGRSVSGGATVTSVLRSASYTTNLFSNFGPGDSGTLRLYKNGSITGSVTFTSSSANGSYTDLVITQSKDYSVVSGGAAGFWRIFSAQGSGSVSSGWNEVYLTHSGAGATSTVSWYYDSSAPGTPTFTSASMVPLSESLTYSSTVPHYNSSTTFRLGVNVSKLSGDMFPTSNTFFTGTAGGAFGAPTSNTYPSVGITYPLVQNLYVSSGSVTVNTTSTITTGFGSSSTGPSVTVDNSYNTGSQTFTTALANTVLYKTGTSNSMEEAAVTFGSTVGTGSGSASRILNPGSTDTPVQFPSATLFNSQTGTLQTYDATFVAAILKHDQTNYSTGYLPVGPNLSSGRSSAQYFTFRFVRTSLSKFNIKFTGTIAGLWVALPGSSIDSAAGATNGWLSMATAYGGAGVPTSGCALGGVVTLNSAVTAHSKTCTFGTVSSSDTSTNEIYVRIKLTSGQSVTALSLETASN
jgi:hypothetical protein